MLTNNICEERLSIIGQNVVVKNWLTCFTALDMNAGQLGLGASWPGSSRPGPILSQPDGNVLNKKRFL